MAGDQKTQSDLSRLNSFAMVIRPCFLGLHIRLTAPSIKNSVGPGKRLVLSSRRSLVGFISSPSLFFPFRYANSF